MKKKISVIDNVMFLFPALSPDREGSGNIFNDAIGDIFLKQIPSAFKMKRQMSYVPMIICWSLIMQAQLWQGRILQTPFFGPNTACRQM